jgi:hypothetical protein
VYPSSSSGSGYLVTCIDTSQRNELQPLSRFGLMSWHDANGSVRNNLATGFYDLGALILLCSRDRVHYSTFLTVSFSYLAAQDAAHSSAADQTSCAPASWPQRPGSTTASSHGNDEGVDLIEGAIANIRTYREAMPTSNYPIQPQTTQRVRSMILDLQYCRVQEAALRTSRYHQVL